MHLASLDGVIGPVADARIPVTDTALLRGDGAFEVIRLYGGRPFALEAHLARLGRTCAGLRLDWDEAALRGEAAALLERIEEDGLLRVVLTRGGRRVLLLEPLPPCPETLRVATVAYRPTIVLDGLKTLSYAGNMLAGRLAAEDHADEALLVTPEGEVLEGPTWSLFYVRDGELLTPPLEAGVLDSITRRVVLETVGAREARCMLGDLLGCDEAFLASTTRELVPIATVDGQALQSTGGPVFRAAQAAFRERVAAEVGASV